MKYLYYFLTKAKLESIGIAYLRLSASDKLRTLAEK